MVGVNVERRWLTVVGAVLMAMPLAGVAAATTGADRGAASQPVSSKAADDADFVKRAAEAGQNEIEAGKRAVARSGPAEVKTFAERMVQDHTVSLAELMSLAAAPPPTTERPPAASTAPQTVQVAPAPPPAAAAAPIDRAYLTESITTHEMLVALYTAQSTDGKDERLKLWAQQKLPMLREHLELARTLRTKLETTTPR